MKSIVKGAVAATAVAASLLMAVPADAAALGPYRFSCSRGISTSIYSPSGYDYHEVNNRYYYWSGPSNYTTQVNWAATSGYWYLEAGGSATLRAWCR